MNIEQQLEMAAGTRHLVFVVFHTGWPTPYEWIEPVLRNNETRIVEFIEVNMEENKAIADLHNIRSIPAFLLLQGGRELWRQVGELTPKELKEMLDDFR